MFLLIDKSKGVTSHDVIDKLRKITSVRKIGHAGTLDPNATGLLIVGIGRESTKKLGAIAKDTTKTYVAEIVLGEERETDDVEGLPRKQVRVSHNAKSVRGDKSGFYSLPDFSKVKEVVGSFIGEQEQVPPEYSAIKIKGKKAYELARRGKEVKLKPRTIAVHSINLLRYEYPKLVIECEVSSGTYIRALARDIGRKLGTGAYLKNLQRTAIGKYKLENAVNLDKLNPDNWEDYGFEL